jgi:hypothetical protein
VSYESSKLSRQLLNLWNTELEPRRESAGGLTRRRVDGPATEKLVRSLSRVTNGMHVSKHAPRSGSELRPTACIRGGSDVIHTCGHAPRSSSDHYLTACIRADTRHFLNQITDSMHTCGHEPLYDSEHYLTACIRAGTRHFLTQSTDIMRTCGHAPLSGSDH